MNQETQKKVIKPTVSINGLRRNLTHALNSHRRALLEVFPYVYDEDTFDKLIESYNALASFVGAFNCVYDDECENDFDMLADILQVDFLEQDY